MTLVILAAITFTTLGCSKKYGGPSDEEAIKAIGESSIFKSGVESITLNSPIVIEEKGKQLEDGSWPVKTKFTYTFTMAGGKVFGPTEKTVLFKLYKSVDSTGKTIWTAK